MAETLIDYVIDQGCAYCIKSLSKTSKEIDVTKMLSLSLIQSELKVDIIHLLPAEITTLRRLVQNQLVDFSVWKPDLHNFY